MLKVLPICSGVSTPIFGVQNCFLLTPFNDESLRSLEEEIDAKPFLRRAATYGKELAQGIAVDENV